MPTYRYIAVNNSGKKLKGTHQGNDEAHILKILKDNKMIPIMIMEIDKNPKKDFGFLKRKINYKDLAVFCRQFYTMLNAGITVITSLDILRIQTENRILKRIIGEVYEDVQKGFTLSKALKDKDYILPELLINMVEVGEVSGNLDTIINSMAAYYEKEYKINNKVKTAMIYPMILAIVSTLVVLFLLTFVMPIFVSMFEGSGVKLPLPTRIFIYINNGILTYWYVYLGIVLLLLYGFKSWVYTDKGRMKWDKLLLTIPLLKETNKKIVTSRFTRTLAILLQSGIPLIYSLEITSKVVGNMYAEEGILKAKERVKKGYSLADPIKKLGIFPPMIYSMIKVGEESGALDSILTNTALYYDEEVEISLLNITTLLEPLMIIFMSIIIGIMITAMVLPMFDMLNTI